MYINSIQIMLFKKIQDIVPKGCLVLRLDNILDDIYRVLPVAEGGTRVTANHGLGEAASIIVHVQAGHHRRSRHIVLGQESSIETHRFCQLS